MTNKILQELYTNQQYIQEYCEMTPDMMSDMMGKLIHSAIDAGLSDCFVRFESTVDYDGLTDGVQLTPCGYRDKTPQEHYDDALRNVACEIKSMIDAPHFGTSNIEAMLRMGKTKEDVLGFFK